MADRRYEEERRYRGELREWDPERRRERFWESRGFEPYRYEELTGREERAHFNLAGLHDLEDLEELRRRNLEDERYWRERSWRRSGWTARSRGVHKAPKGYTRSDERIREDICERLMHSPFDASEVEVTVQSGEVTLKGTVRARVEKWGIEEVASSALGVVDVNNQIRIDRGEPKAIDPATAADTRHLHS